MRGSIGDGNVEISKIDSTVTYENIDYLPCHSRQILTNGLWVLDRTRK
jgi:hypothetical protein